MHRPAFARTAPLAAHEPLSALNITPLIDVLLVLLVMMILTIPIMTHEVPLDLPGGNGPAAVPVTHRLAIARGGGLSWDGAAIAPAALPAVLTRVEPDADVVLAPDAEARYEVVDATLASVRRSGVTRLGFVGNERFAALN